MKTAVLPITINKKAKEKFLVEIDKHAFERLADSLGLFRQDFIESIERAETDIARGRVKKLRTLRDFRR